MFSKELEQIENEHIDKIQFYTININSQSVPTIHTNFGEAMREYVEAENNEARVLGFLKDRESFTLLRIVSGADVLELENQSFDYCDPGNKELAEAVSHISKWLDEQKKDYVNLFKDFLRRLQEDEYSGKQDYWIFRKPDGGCFFISDASGQVGTVVTGEITKYGDKSEGMVGISKKPSCLREHWNYDPVKKLCAMVADMEYLGTIRDERVSIEKSVGIQERPTCEWEYARQKLEERDHLKQQMETVGYEPAFLKVCSNDFLMWKQKSSGKVFGLDGWESVKCFLEGLQNGKPFGVDPWPTQELKSNHSKKEKRQKFREGKRKESLNIDFSL